MKNQPIYCVHSVDHALHLIALLQQEGPLRVSDAAERLGVARSTAHRLLAVLVFRDFAEQGPDGRYRAGSMLRRELTDEPVHDIRRAALPVLRELTDGTNETTHLVVVNGDLARFVVSVQCTQPIRVGDREGHVLPAHLTSGGRAVLAARTDDEVEAILTTVRGADSPVLDVPHFLRNLARVRRQGFAINDQATEIGLTAIGCPVPARRGKVEFAVCIALPTARYRRESLAEWIPLLSLAAARIGRALPVAPTGRGDLVSAAH